MRLTRSILRRVVLTGATTGLILTTVLSANGAQAAPAGIDSLGAESLTTRLADRSGGSYVDSVTGRIVVTVTDAAAASTVRAAGADVKLVSRSTAQLESITEALGRTATIPGTTWSIDPRTNQILATADSTVTGAKLAQFKAATSAFGDAVRVEYHSGVISLAISGGQAITTGGSRCSLGFNVQNSAGQQYFVTAGHCTNIGTTWSGGGQTLGTRAGTSFPGNDYGIVRYTTSVARPGNVWLYSGSSTQDITSARNATVNETVRRSGSTTGVHSGRVLQNNATVNYPQGSVSGLIRTNVCAEPGDSGGSLFAGSAAIGMTSGGSGNCSSGGTTYFQPVVEALNAYGVNVY